MRFLSLYCLSSVKFYIYIFNIARERSKSLRISSENDIQAHTNNNWIFAALTGGVLLAFGNFFMGKISTGGVYAREVIMVGNFIASIIYFITTGMFLKFSNIYFKELVIILTI